MNIVQTHSFKRAVKKLYPNQKQALDDAVRSIMQQPETGNLKKGDLAGVRVHKFQCFGQLTLLGYHYNADAQVVTLIAIGPHENFYRDLKR
ncbi:MAG: type II toxin-antitoxin system RelE/ParE family toxin [Mariprofundaceae bacterium]|nr:type II toxin-antitoxin system RelE/ParE family toxin [Mariprofundaceae bacterium]